MVSTPGERTKLAVLGEVWPGVPWDRLLFSAKESVYKAWAPVVGTFLDFDGADVTFDPAAGTFTARLLVPGAAMVCGVGDELHGRFLVRGGLAVTAVTAPVSVDRRSQLERPNHERMPARRGPAGQAEIRAEGGCADAGG